jgi:hypothetical protein
MQIMNRDVVRLCQCRWLAVSVKGDRGRDSALCKRHRGTWKTSFWVDNQTSRIAGRHFYNKRDPSRIGLTQCAGSIFGRRSSAPR